jgi:Holliday junction resolvase RusA-like endonuclease
MIELYYDFVFLNEYINAERRNKYIASKIKRDTTHFVMWSVMNHEKIKTPTRLKFTWLIPNKRRDLDNIAYAKKYILDGFVKAKLIPSDNLKHIIGFTDEFEISNKIGVRIEVY